MSTLRKELEFLADLHNPRDPEPSGGDWLALALILALSVVLLVYCHGCH